MSMQLITYDLNRPGQNYPNLWDAIKRLGTHWHPLESVWFVETGLTSMQIRDALRPHIDTNDKLFVSRVVEAAWAGPFNAGAENWLKQVVAESPVL